MPTVVLASVRRPLILILLCVAMGACGMPDRSWIVVEDQLQGAIASSTGYSVANIEVLASPARVSVSISDRQLARADHSMREHVANAVVAAVQLSKATHPQLAGLQEIRVVIVHPALAHGLLISTHTEDVLEFRKGPNGQFYWDVL